ncbi:hypothetical protein CFY91_01930 [Pseudomonas fluvialis]|nr:hypothetical protein CFY91_01930 [Pseudomonas fluvialis]
MPCIAMGIPVVFLYDKKKVDDYRVGIIKDLIGIQYVGETRLDRIFLNRLRGLKFDWNPQPLEFESEKLRIREGYLSAFERAVARFGL